MKIDTFIQGPLSTSAYLVSSKDEAVLIDCGGDEDKVIAFVEEKGLDLKYILLTHGHGDHFAGVNKVREATGAQIGLHALDVPGLTMPFNLSICDADPVSEDFLVKEGDKIKFGDVTLKVIETPGHTPGGVCYYAKDHKVLFTGDTLFKTGVGRDDFPGGSLGRLSKSLHRLLKMDVDIKIFPGHGQQSTIGSEKKFLAKSGIL